VPSALGLPSGVEDPHEDAPASPTSHIDTAPKHCHTGSTTTAQARDQNALRVGEPARGALQAATPACRAPTFIAVCGKAQPIAARGLA
jgi:hypothetical protein